MREDVVEFIDLVYLLNALHDLRKNEIHLTVARAFVADRRDHAQAGTGTLHLSARIDCWVPGEKHPRVNTSQINYVKPKRAASQSVLAIPHIELFTFHRIVSFLSLTFDKSLIRQIFPKGVKAYDKQELNDFLVSMPECIRWVNGGSNLPDDYIENYRWGDKSGRDVDCFGD